MEASNPWEKIQKPDNTGTFNSIRAAEKTNHNFWWTIDFKGNCGLAVEFNQHIKLPKSVPNFSSIEILVAPDKKFLLIVLTKSEDVKKFRILCNDLISDSQPIKGDDEVNLLATIILSLKRWQNLFEVKKIKTPSLSQRLGLLGELNCLVNFLAKYTDFRQAVKSWQGPKGHEQDFLINGNLIEVKAQLSSSDKIVKINSLEQLDTISGPIWLQHTGLSPCTLNNGQAISINLLIQEIVNGLDGDNFGLDLFATLLEVQGFSLENDYGDDLYAISYLKIYGVANDFPKITRKTIGSNAVLKAQYSINMSELDPWLKDVEFVKSRVFA
jgi:hypothetical protein